MTPILQWVVILPFFIGFCLWGVLITAIASPSNPTTSTHLPTLTATFVPPTFTFTPTRTNIITLTPTNTNTPTITSTATETATQTITFTPTLTSTSTSTSTLTLPEATGTSCVNQNAERVLAEVVRIVDGDTIVVNIGGHRVQTPLHRR